MWFPAQSAKIVGAGTFMGPGAQQIVVESQAVGADCGTAHVDVLYYDASMHMIMTTLSVENPCGLDAKIVRGKNGDELQLTGPYYAKDAPLYKPTKPHATATLHFVNGKGVWAQTPAYFKIVTTP